MKNSIYVLIISFLLFGSSCSKNDPLACFVIPPTIELNQEYKFEDCSVNAVDYQWDFGDGQTAEIANPLHTYTNEGTFTISLIVNNKGKKDVIRRTINTFSDDITESSSGIYTGTYTEHYADSSDLDKEYAGAATVSPTGTKDIKVALIRGSFEANVIGDLNTGYTFTHVTELQPERLQMMTSGSGSYVKTSNTFSFKLSGKDPQTGLLNWSISFTGVKN